MKARLAFALYFLFLLPSVAPAQEVASPKLDIWLPVKAWALELDAPGFAVRTNEIQPDGRRYFLAENKLARAALSVYLEAEKTERTRLDCTQGLQARAANPLFSHKNVTLREQNGMQILEFKIPEVDGVPANQQNLFACWVKDRVFIDLHLSKMFYRAADQSLFDAILGSIQFPAREPATGPVPVGNSMQLIREGSRFYLAQQYREAIGPYQKALDIERITPTLDKNLWRVLVDNLGMSYGITGNLTRAKEIFEYGVSKDPEFPMFYYNLACTTAERGDEDDTKSFLKMAFQYRNNMIPGEQFPDPRADDSFQRLLLHKKFRQWLNALLTP